jgi:hypothetical protein
MVGTIGLADADVPMDKPMDVDKSTSDKVSEGEPMSVDNTMEGEEVMDIE